MKKIGLLLMLLAITFTVVSQEVTINTENSQLKWTGKKVTGEHWGYINLKSGTLMLEANKIANAKFIIDMTSITCEDLEDEEWNAKLVGHLKSDDFFSTDKYNAAVLKINESTVFIDGTAELKGDLTIKGITKPISFEAEKTENGYMATITVDRTLYNVRYGSGKFFDGLGDKMIYDEFTLEVMISVK